jgi:hypothetical protein
MLVREQRQVCASRREPIERGSSTPVAAVPTRWLLRRIGGSLMLGNKTVARMLAEAHMPANPRRAVSGVRTPACQECAEVSGAVADIVVLVPAMIDGEGRVVSARWVTDWLAARR